MKVVVKLHGVLRKHRPKDIPGGRHQLFELKLNDGTQIKELVSLLGIESGMVAGSAVNGEVTSDDSQLYDADEVSLFPPVAGG
ncbi:MAG: hypothetical protein BMS9Abin02_1132 [Anaerolineae bacterium]|nr:MAG: hypothetical protein BMS9Abin02_1132 [Anaerolineae bacterium]